MKSLLKRKEIGILMVIVALSLLITIINPTFFTVENIIDLVKSNVVLGIMALGMLPVLISGGIDLSVSSTIALSAVVVGKVLVNYNTNIVVIILVSIITGGAIGAINGVIIAKLQIPPIVTTLGIMSIVLGTVMYYTNGDWINNLPRWFINFGDIKIGGFLPVQIVFLIAVVIVSVILLKYTLVGRGIYAIGGSESSAMRVGYNVDRLKIFTYTFCGAISGLAAVVHSSIYKQVDPNTFGGTELNVIVAVVIGGTSTMGGVGTVLGTLLGVLLMGIIQNGLVLAKVPTFWQKIAMGLIIIFAVSFDVINRKREQAKLERIDVEE